MRILVLSYAFPPVAAAESYVAAKAFGNIKDENIKIDVISLQPEDGIIAADCSIDDYVNKHYNNVWRMVLPKWEQKILRSWPRLFNILLQFPDKFVFVNRQIMDLEKKIELTKYDVIITRSQWHSIHLVGLKLKNKYPHLYWIAHFSDPWVDNPLAWHLPIANWFCKKWERKVVKYADKITLTTPETINLMFRKYPEKYKNKAVYIPHSYDESLYDKRIVQSNENYVIRCLGGFYGARSPKPFFEAVDQLARKYPALLTGILIEFYGIHGRHKECLQNYSYARKYIKTFSNVTYQESLYLMQSSHCLLSIEAPLDQSVFFPSKLVDYMGAGAHIFSISSQGAAVNILKSVEATVADVHDQEDIYIKLTQLLTCKPNQLNENIKKFSNKIVMKSILELFDFKEGTNV